MQYFFQDLMSWFFHSGLIIGGYWLIGKIVRGGNTDDEG